MPVKIIKGDVKFVKGRYYFKTSNGWSSFSDICIDYKDKFKVAESTAYDRIFTRKWDWEEAIITPPLHPNDLRRSHQMRKHYRRLQKGITKIKI